VKNWEKEEKAEASGEFRQKRCVGYPAECRTKVLRWALGFAQKFFGKLKKNSWAIYGNATVGG
jgi:hypothetical protein